MFLRRSIEILTFVLYWLLLVPLLYNFALDQKFIVYDLNNLKLTFSRYGIAIAVAVLVYMIVYRISVWIYIRCKKADIKMYNSMKSLAMDVDELERQAKQIREQQSKHHLVKQAKTKKLQKYLKWLPSRKTLSNETSAHVVVLAPQARSLPETPTTQRKKLFVNRMAPPPPVQQAASTLPRSKRDRPYGTATTITTSPSIHTVPTMIKMCVSDDKRRTPALNARIAALQASANSSPIFKNKSMSNPAFVSCNGDWV